MLISFESVERVSSSAVETVDFVADLKSKGLRVSHYVFPDRSTHVGKLIDDIAKKKKAAPPPETMALLVAANRAERAADIRKDLDDGKVVVVEGYVHSGIAHGMADGLSRSWLEHLEKHMPRPDKVVLNAPGEGDVSSGKAFEAYASLGVFPRTR